MLRTIRVTTFLLITTAVWSLPAKADLWDWFAELSGPGPFNTRGNLTVTVYCHQSSGFKADRAAAKAANTADDTSANSQWFHVLQRKAEKGPCIFVDVRRFNTPKHKDDPRYFPVRMEVYEAGPTYRLTPFLEVGAGIGLIHFNSGGIKTDRLILDIPRVALKPLLLVPKWQTQRHGGAGFIQLYYRASMIQGELTQDNFRPKPGTIFRTNNDLVPSVGFMVDPIALVRLITNK